MPHLGYELDPFDRGAGHSQTPGQGVAGEVAVSVLWAAGLHRQDDEVPAQGRRRSDYFRLGLRASQQDGRWRGTDNDGGALRAATSGCIDGYYRSIDKEGQV